MIEESKLFGVSIRGWLAIILVLTVCIRGGIFGENVSDTLNSMATLALGFYFGQKVK